MLHIGEERRVGARRGKWWWSWLWTVWWSTYMQCCSCLWLDDKSLSWNWWLPVLFSEMHL